MHIYVVTPTCENQSTPCNCSYIKKYNESLDISCVDLTDNCTWFHTINNVPMEIEKRFRTNSRRNITLQKDDPLSYGYFNTVNSTGDTCNYLVTPPLGNFYMSIS